MKVLVFSDSHGFVSEMENAVFRHTPDYIIHLGDYVSDVLMLRETFPRIPFSFVKGNCDFSSPEPTEQLLTLGGVPMLLTHGHRYDVKMGYDRLLYAAEENKVKLVLFGHTHYQTIIDEAGVVLFNPGSIRDYAEYGLLELSNGKIRCLPEHG